MQRDIAFIWPKKSRFVTQILLALRPATRPRPHFICGFNSRTPRVLGLFCDSSCAGTHAKQVRPQAVSSSAVSIAMMCHICSCPLPREWFALILTGCRSSFADAAICQCKLLIETWLPMFVFRPVQPCDIPCCGQSSGLSVCCLLSHLNAASVSSVLVYRQHSRSPYRTLFSCWFSDTCCTFVTLSRPELHGDHISDALAWVP